MPPGDIHQIHDSIERIVSLSDKFTKPYLLITTTEKQLQIFAFSGMIAVERWENLKEGCSYNFTVRESKIGTLVLNDFEEEILI